MERAMGRRRCVAMLVALGFVVSCTDDPNPNNGDVEDEPISGSACGVEPSYSEDVSGCSPLSSDYRPREPAANNDVADLWPNCVSEDDVYHKIEETVSSVARVQAYEAMAELLWRGGVDPTHENFQAARSIYSDAEGLGSRVGRRFDPHMSRRLRGVVRM
ncbi:MAG: hypothetical protein R3C68_12765 [Myxococcota bacterium]